MTRRVGWMLGSSLLTWAAVAYPAYALGGEPQLTYSAVALALCLVPAALTMLAAEWSFRKAPEHYLMIVFGGTGLRMFVVLGGGVAINNANAYFQSRSFWLWILAFYLVTLALEVVFLVTGRTSPAGPDRP